MGAGWIVVLSYHATHSTTRKKKRLLTKGSIIKQHRPPLERVAILSTPSAAGYSRAKLSSPSPKWCHHAIMNSALDPPLLRYTCCHGAFALADPRAVTTVELAVSVLVAAS
jgi:hypothetical protein